MSDRLRAAAERIRTGEVRVEDLHKLAAAYIVEHPADDDEPLTQEWLRTMRGRQDPNRIECAAWQFVLWLWEEGTECDLTCECGQCEHQTELPLPHITTRGEVRRLCQALGVKLGDTAATSAGDCHNDRV